MDKLQISTSLDLARENFSVEYVEGAPVLGNQDFHVRLLVRGTEHAFTYTPIMKRLSTEGNLIQIILPSRDNAVLQTAVFDWQHIQKETLDMRRRRGASAWGPEPSTLSETAAPQKDLRGGRSSASAATPRKRSPLRK